MKMYKLLVELLMEGLSLEDAVAVFNKYGVPHADTLKKDELKLAWHRLAKKFHSDVSSHGKESIQDINSAYDVLSDSPRPYSTVLNSPVKPTATVRPAWQTDPRAMVGADEPEKPDVNYYKKKAWEISGKPAGKDDIYTFWNWDGYYFRGVFTVFAIPEKWFDISEFMREWDSSYRSKAVFVSSAKAPQSLNLVNLEGRKIDPPQIFTHGSKNQNPENDWTFNDKLRKAI